MTAATIYKASRSRFEELVTNDTLPVKKIIKAASVSTANPTDTVATTHTSEVYGVAATVTGVALGDIVLGYGVVSGLATNQLVVGAFVSDDDEVTVLVSNLSHTTVTTTAVVMNFVIADVT